MRKMFLSLLCLPVLAFLAGCGTSHTIPIPRNPSGGNDAGFSNASMTGTYVFNVNGSTTDGFLAVAGSFTADGNGNITGGTRDTVNHRRSQTLNEAITGSYFVNIDGRGQVVLNGPSGRAIYRLVMQSPDKASLLQDGTTDESISSPLIGNIAVVIIDAVGTIERQSGTPATPTGTYVLRVEGQDSGGNLDAAIGGISFSGNNINGAIDENDSGTFSANLAANGSISLSGTRGTASIGTHRFLVYFVSPTRIELLATDADFLLFGEAEAQSSFAGTTAALSGAAPDQVFSLSGVDTGGSRVEVGRVTLGSNGELANGIEDISNHRGEFSAVALDGSTYTVGANGRWTANLVNSEAPTATLVGWQLSPQRSIVLTSDSNTVETGTMLAQTLGLTTANVSGDFAEQLSGFSSDFGNFELIGQLRLDGAGSLRGRFDAQDDVHGLLINQSTSGAYAIDPGLGRTTTGGVEELHVVMYAVDIQTIEFIPSHSGVIYQGELKQQQP